MHIFLVKKKVDATILTVILKDIILQMQAQGIKFEDVGKKPTRNELMKQLYEFYVKDKKNLDIATYKKWLRRNGVRHTVANALRWKEKSGEWKKPITDKSFASFWLSHIPTEDLFYLVSIARDKERRKESFNKWLFWALKA